MHRSAVRHLKRSDPKLAALIERVGPCRFETRSEGTHFDAVARAIVYQQLSGKAAATILSRFHALYGARTPTPDELLSTPLETLRAVGLSRQKSAYLYDLAARTKSGALPIDTLQDLDDGEIMVALTGVKGVGRWTAQMFLMFRLGRPDVLPELDLGIRKAIQLAYGMRKMPTPRQLAMLAARWRPYCTIASWYLWRSLDLPKTGSVKTAVKRPAIKGQRKLSRAASKPKPAAMDL
ncbi:MAG: DNA-3-methyladenine glycosylase 2 family protein [Anaerolineae bacterium]|nr:DNA-3-methyladenine glycosylase 2 family protein [Gemmatimonadaceae bacterium]